MEVFAYIIALIALVVVLGAMDRIGKLRKRVAALEKVNKKG